MLVKWSWIVDHTWLKGWWNYRKLSIWLYYLQIRPVNPGIIFHRWTCHVHRHYRLPSTFNSVCKKSKKYKRDSNKIHDPSNVERLVAKFKTWGVYCSHGQWLCREPCNLSLTWIKSQAVGKENWSLWHRYGTYSSSTGTATWYIMFYEDNGTYVLNEDW